MNFIIELVEALKADKIKLLAAFGALAKRGAVPETEHREEVGLLGRMGEDGRLDPAVVRALIRKLETLQVPADSVGADDVTVVKPAMSAQVVQPAMSDGPMEDAEVTRVSPSPRPVASVAAAAVGATISGTVSATGSTGTHSASSFSHDSWQRMARVEGGDYATVGMLLKGRFQLEREIGRGGMGVVYLALDERKIEARDRDPYVAVKVLNDEFRRHPDSLIALQRESRRAQLLAHDNIVRVYDFDKDRTIVFMTMEYIDGSDLRTLIRERAYNGLPLSEARPLIEGMARALQRAHAAGIVHSDFKPGNVMVTRDGVPKVFDFGIARAGKFQSDATGEQTVFDAGTLGAMTPAYASLEMLQGKEPTPGDDLYALGCVAFELLTGKHPFDKVSAEVAQREGRKPPAVPGLTRRQYKALCDSVAFTAEHRLKTADALIEGLRDVGLRERAGPYLVSGIAALVVLGAGGWGLSTWMHRRHVDKVIAQFDVNNPQHYADESQAMSALGSLGEDDRKRLVLDQSDVIQNFFLYRIGSYWEPSKSRFDFAGAQRVFNDRDKLRLYSPLLDARRDQVEQQRNELLNTLDTQLADRIAAGAIFESQPDNVVATLTQIRAIDPHSALLDNAELELKYDIAISHSLNGGQVDEARRELALATRLFPQSARLRQRGDQLAVLSASLAANAPAAPGAQAAPAMGLPEARSALSSLLAKPEATPAWQGSVASAMAALHNDTTPETRALVDKLGDTVADMVSRESGEEELPQAIGLLNFGQQYAPKSTGLAAQRDRLDAMQQQVQKQLEQEANAAEVASRIESVRRAAAANDFAKAQESLARIKALQPDNAFLGKEGPQLVGTAFLGAADAAYRQGKYEDAGNVLAQGIKVLGNRSDLRNAKARYDLVAALLQTRAQPLDDAGYQALTKQLADVRAADGEGLRQMEADMKERGKLPQGTLTALLASLKPSGAASPSASPAGAPGAPGAEAPANATPGSAAPASRNAHAKSAVGASATAGADASTASGPQGPDPCEVPELVGKGKVCFDTLGEGLRGPSLVVVPGLAGGKPFAISRSEITINDYNRYCNASHQCAPIAVEDKESGSLPISNIALAQAKAYARWLSSASGNFVYRLPTDAEWSYAAEAGSGWKQATDSNCVPPTANGGDTQGGPISSRGREANPWGLINMTGNVWEWVTSGDKTLVRGGSFNSYWSDCTVASKREDSGTAQKDVGFRILRELK